MEAEDEGKGTCAYIAEAPALAFRFVVSVLCVCDIAQSALVLTHARAQVNVKDTAGRTPLHMAAAYGATPVARLLLEKGADPDVQVRPVLL